MLNQKILTGTSSPEVKRKNTCIWEPRRWPGLPWAFLNCNALAGGGLSLDWYCWGYGSRTSDSSGWWHWVACEDLPGAEALWDSKKKRRQPGCVQATLVWFPWLPGCAGSWTVPFGFPGRVEFSSVIHSVLLLSKKPSIGGKSVECWSTFHLWQRKAFTFHMKLWINLATFEENLRKLLTVFKLAATDSYWHSLMEGVNPERPLSPSELWIHRGPRRWTDGEQNASFIRDTENDGDGGNNGFLKLFPRIRLAFPLSYWQHWKKDIFLLGVRTLFYMAENTSVLCTHFWTVKGKQKDGLWKLCALSPALQWDLGALCKEE